MVELVRIERRVDLYRQIEAFGILLEVASDRKTVGGGGTGVGINISVGLDPGSEGELVAPDRQDVDALSGIASPSPCGY